MAICVVFKEKEIPPLGPGGLLVQVAYCFHFFRSLQMKETTPVIYCYDKRSLFYNCCATLYLLHIY